MKLLGLFGYKGSAVSLSEFLVVFFEYNSFFKEVKTSLFLFVTSESETE